jgi:hypothetical protein
MIAGAIVYETSLFQQTASYESGLLVHLHSHFNSIAGAEYGSSGGAHMAGAGALR